MLKVQLEVCTCCAHGVPSLVDAVAHLRAEHPDWLDVVERDCLDICQAQVGAVKLDGATILVQPEAVPMLQERVTQAVARRARRCSRCRARVCSGVCK